MTDTAPQQPARGMPAADGRPRSRFDLAVMGGLIDETATEPLYQQVKRIILEQLHSMSAHPGRPLPSSRYLASALGVSRNTVTLAYQELTALGYLESRPRSGIYPTGRAGDTSPGQTLAMPPRGLDWSTRLPPSPSTGIPARSSHADWSRFPYPFLPGQPELDGFPVRAWLRALGDAMGAEHRAHSLGDRVGQDDRLLIDAIRREILVPRGVIAGPENILITHGSQNALALLSGAVLRDGSTVAMGNPGYVDAAHIFLRAGATLRTVPVDANGVVVDTTHGIDAFYVTPSHHHPTNTTLSLRRRDELLARAAADDFLVIEDDYDSEVRFRGRPTATLFSRDDSGRTIYLGTFSKFLAPGLRVGYVVAPAPLIAAMRERRDFDTKHPAGHVQRALALFIASGDYHRALRLHRNMLAQKFTALRQALIDEIDWMPPTPPAGGLSLWLTGPPGFDSEDVARRARERGVLVDPGTGFFLPEPGESEQHRSGLRHVRLGFNSIALAAIPAGVREFAAAVDESRRAAITRQGTADRSVA